MKKIALLLFVSVLLSSQLFSATYYGKEANDIIQGTEVLRFKDFSDIPSFIKFKKGSEIQYADIINWMKRFYKSDNNFDFKLINRETDRLGIEHYRYQQTYNNIPVELTMYIFHVKNGKVISANGNLYDKINISQSASVSETEALSNAKVYVGAETYMWEMPGQEAHIKKLQEDPNATYFPKADMVIISENGNIYKGKLNTAYKFNIYAHKPVSRAYIYVDANTGEILFENKIIHTADVPGTAETGYSGTRTLTADSYSGYYRLRETGRGLGVETYDMNNGTNYGSAVDFTDSDNFWNNANPELDEYAADAHWATEMTYDYYYNTHSRNSIDGSGFKLISYIHYDTDYANAFWNGNYMTYGDGNGSTISPLTTVDICAHEITHGLTSYTAALVYSYESGALNEAFSDIFGTTVEFYAKPLLANWDIGEDIGTTFRSLADPNAYNLPDTYLGNYWATGSGDYGGVHTNCGVLMHWYYLISEGGSGTNDNGDSYNISPIGMDKAGDITYRLLTVYLTPSSQYMDARFYAIQSAIDLYGACTPEVEEVTNAMYAVGLGNAYTPNVVSDFEADYTQSCIAPFTVQFTNMSVNGTNFDWDFGDGGTSTDINPTHTYTTLGTFNVQLFSDGGVCGTDTEIKTSYIEIDTTLPCIAIMPTSGTYTHYSCDGKLYDTGGATNNYPDQTDVSFTISPPGATQITLDILSFSVEAGSGSTCDFDYIAFYDGPDISSPLINGTLYCNTTGSPGTITSTGGDITVRQYSDQAVTESGFELDWTCYYPSTPPVANFSVINNTTCTGTIIFTDNSSNAPTSWNWDFGDGNVSTDQNPVYTYTSNGTYTVTLIAINAYGSDTITIIDYIFIVAPDMPVTTGATICENETAILSATASGEIYWYDAVTAGNLLDTGITYTTPPLTVSTTYYVENSVSQSPQNVGETNNTGDGGFLGATHYLVFDCFTPVTLLSVEVNAETTADRTIELRDNLGAVLQSITLNIPAGISRIDLNFDIPIDNNLQLACAGTPDLFRTNANTNYPYVLSGLLSINYSSATTPTGYYYYFYDWEVQELPCLSQRDSVEAIVEALPTADFSYSTNFLDVSLTNNSTNATSYNWDFGDGNTSTDQDPIHTYSADGTYTITLIASNNCGNDTSFIIITVVGVSISDKPELSDVEIYPNPTNDKLFVSIYNPNNNAEIQLLDINGKMICRQFIKSTGKNKTVLDMSDLSGGVYLCKIITDIKIITKQVVLIK